MKHFFLGLTLVLLGSVLAADEVTINTLVFKDVSVISGTDTELTFEAGGQTVRKAMDKVTRILWSNHEEFNKAENATSTGDYEQAIKLYDAQIPRAVGIEKSLLMARKNYALRKLGKPAAGNAAPTAAPAADAKECPICRNSGSVLCETCDRTGKARCEVCRGKGKIVCATCKGAYRRNPCPTCNATGYIDYKLNPSQKYYDRKTCTSCSGSGYGWVCPICIGGYEKGQVKCPECGGSGRIGVCATCNGTKKAGCSRCNPGAVPEPAAVPSKPKPSALPEREGVRVPATPVGNPFASPENLAAHVANAMKDPREKREWNTWNSIRQEEELKKYDESLADPEKAVKVIGVKVTWRVKLIDAVEASDANTYVVTAESAGGLTVTATMSEKAKNLVAKLVKGAPFNLTGTIQSYNFKSGGSIFAAGEAMGVVLEEANIVGN